VATPRSYCPEKSMGGDFSHRCPALFPESHRIMKSVPPSFRRFCERVGAHALDLRPRLARTGLNLHSSDPCEYNVITEHGASEHED
jgi:hypothetical protein